MELIFKGVVTGLLLSIMIGPVFFVLLETSIRKGIKAAIAFDLGVLLNDVLYISIALLFYNQVEQLSSGNDNSLLKIIGGGLFITYGIINFFKKVKKIEVETENANGSGVKGYLLLGLKGFLLNLANPLVVFYWFSVLTIGAEDSGTGGITKSMIFFVAIILITFFSVDLLKIIGAKSLRPLITDKVLKGLNWGIGIIFMLFGGVLIAQGVIDLLRP